MQRIVILHLIAVLCFISPSQAQQFVNAFTDKSPNAVIHPSYRVATDGMGNMINGSAFSGTLQIGGLTFPSNGTLGTYIVKRDANDSILWARSLTCGSVVVLGGIYCDNDDNVYVTGLFGTNTIPSYSTTLTSFPHPITIASGSCSFVVKYAPDGTVIWARNIPVAPGTNYVNSDLFRISGNGTDRIAITAPFASLPPTTVAGTVLDSINCNMFWAFADSAGNWTHALPISAPNTSYSSMSLSMAPNGSCYFSGSANGTLNFGTAGTLNTSGSLRDFVAKINSNGTYNWYRSPNGTSSWWRTEVLADNNGAFFLGGFSGNAQFGTINLTSLNNATYMSRLDAAGNWQSAYKYGNQENRFYGACRNANRIFISGYTDSNIGVTSNTFGTYLLDYTASLSPTVLAAYDMSYVLELDLNGQVIQGSTFANSFATLNVWGMAASSNDVYLTGPVTGSAYFSSFYISNPQVNSCNYVAKYGIDANTVRGTCFYDFNSNNIFDGVDVDAVDLVSLQGGSSSVNVWANGAYNVGVNDGVSYNITIPTPPQYYSVTPSSHSAFFSSGSANQVDSLNDFAFQPIPNQNDLEVFLSMGAMRPGFNGTGVLTLKNVGTTTKTGVLNLLLNSANLTVDSIAPAAGTNINVNSATFNYNLNPTQSSNWLVRYKLDSTAVLGTWIQSIASAADPSDLTPTNNFDTVMTVVTGSYDPNNKLVYPDSDWSIASVSSGLDLEYTINFQNTGTDTAFTVVITDTISPFLDLSTMEVLSSSHPVVVNISNRKVFFRFYNINLPDSNVNELLSHGNVRYRIRPNTNCIVGDEVLNTAYIYFDFNQPIITNTTQNTVVMSSGLEELGQNYLLLYPNPAIEGWFNVYAPDPIKYCWIHDVSGRLLYESAVSNPLQFRFDAQYLNSGTYLIKIQTGKGVFTSRFIR